MTTADTTIKEVRTLPQLNKDAAVAAAQKWIAEQMHGLTDAETRAVKASRLYLTERVAARNSATARDAAVWTLITGPYRLRRGAGLAGAVGYNRSGLQKLKDRQALNPPALVPNADKVLPRLAETAMKHATREKEARDARDAAVQQLVKAGVTNADVARLIGSDTSRVSHIKHKESAA